MGKKEEPTGLAKYDRAMLESMEVQPIAEQDGYVITVNNRGYFMAVVEEGEITATTLENAKEKVHRHHMAQQKKKKVKTGGPCFVVGSRKDGYSRAPVCGDVFFRGVHAGHGALLFRWPDGSAFQSDAIAIFPADHPEKEQIKALFDEVARLEKALNAASRKLKRIEVAQQEKMYDGMDMGLFGKTPHVRNDAEKAFDATTAIMRNVFGKKV
jgi:hypothetical protein